MANIDIEQRPRGNILPWLIGLAILVVVVGWLLWRNNRIPEVEGAREAPALHMAARADAAMEEAPWRNT